MPVKEVAEGVRALFTAMPAAVLAVRRRFWVETSGFVVGCDVQNLSDIEGRRVPNYFIVYEYGVDGTQYSGVDRIPIKAKYYEFDDVLKELSTRYREGAGIPVYFNPKNTTESSIRRGVVGLGSALFIVMVGLLAGIAYYIHFICVHA